MFRKQFAILFAILLLSINLKAQQQNGSVFETRITISQKNQSINSILDQISWQAGVYFSYDASILNPNQKYNIEVSDKSLYTVLNQLFNPSDFLFTELENQIIISKNTADKISEEIKVDSIPVKYFFLSGKIVDNKKGDPIKYASISLLNKPIGTITNVDGNFILKIHPNFIRDTISYFLHGICSAFNSGIQNPRRRRNCNESVFYQDKRGKSCCNNTRKIVGEY